MSEPKDPTWQERAEAILDALEPYYGPNAPWPPPREVIEVVWVPHAEKPKQPYEKANEAK